MKVKFLIAALFFSLVAAAQPSNYIKFNTRGRWIAGMFDSTLHVPRFNGSPSLRTGGSSMDGAIAIDTTNGIFYFYQGGSWKRANLDTSAYAVTSVYRKTASDSVFYVKGGVHTFAFKDSTGGGTPTLQQVLTAGSTLTGGNDINLDGNEFRFLGGSGDFLVQDVNLIDLINDNDNGIQIGTAEGVLIRPNVGVLKIDTLNYTLSTTGKKILIRDTATGLVQNIDPSLLGASSYTFTNGLTESGGTVKLGGTLMEAITTIDADGNDLVIKSNSTVLSSSIYLSGQDLDLFANSGGPEPSSIRLKGDSLEFEPLLGRMSIDTLAAASNMTNKRVMTWDTVTKRWEQIAKDSVGGGGSTSPAGSDTYVQFNDGGSFGGDAGLNYNKTDNELKINTATDNGAYKLQGEGGMYWKLDGTNAFKIVHSVGADRVTINGSSGNLDAYTFSSQNFSTSSAGSSTFNGSYMRQSGGAYFQGWQQPFSMIRTYPGTGSSPQSTVIFDNTTETSPASDYQIATFKLSGTSVAFVDKDGKYNAQSTVTAGGTTGNQTINKPTGTVNIAAAGSTVTVTNSTCTANSIVYAVLRTNDATATGIKSVVPSAGSFVITLNAAATAEVSVGFIVFN